MSSPRQVTARDLAEEAKKRIVFLAICVIGLSYLMSLTSSSVWVNLPAAATLIIALRYFSMDFDMRRKAAVYNSKKPASTTASLKNPVQTPKVVTKSNWRRKVDSPVVEDAMDCFTRHLVSEWVTDLWYSRLTPDREGPEELVRIINDVLAEFSDRVRNINLIDLLTRDIVCLICTHLEVFRMTQAKIEKQQFEHLTVQQLDGELRRILASENKLHPALFSIEAEHKVLQHIMDGLISFTFKPEDLQCSFFRFIVRELLACAVMRPVLNLANPRFINGRIESFVISKTKANKGAISAHEASPSKNGTRVSSDHFSRFLDPTVTGVELVQLKTSPSKSASSTHNAEDINGTYLSKDPLLSMDARSSRSWNSLPVESQNGDDKGILRHRAGGEWGEMLDVISRRKAQALAPEHFENMWAKGRNYRKKEGENRLIEQVPKQSLANKAVVTDHSRSVSKPKGKDQMVNNNPPGGGTSSAVENPSIQPNKNLSGHSLISVTEEDDDQSLMRLEEADSASSSYTSEDEEAETITGLDSPGTKVWDGKSNRNVGVTPIHHPLETFEGSSTRNTGKGHPRYQRFSGTRSGRKRSRLSSTKVHVWQEIERTSFLSGDGQDILHTSKGYGTDDASSDDSENEILGRANSGAAASSSAPSVSLLECHISNTTTVQNSLVVDSFLKLRCEVLGANIVKSGSKTFAVYSISVTDVNNNSWSIKRRFRHFEELHRRLKEFPEYNLHLPPKHFLSTGLDIFVIQERCKLLDKYLKKLMQLPTISGSIEVWDFLSVDSQTYYFSSSFSIIETLSVDLEDKPSQKSKRVSSFLGSTINPLSSRRDNIVPDNKETPLQMKHDPVVDCSRPNVQDKIANSRGSDATEETSEALLDAATDPTLPSEWVPPNLSVPLLDLVDVIFQLQDGGWIRRKAFWVAKQILQLGMGDAFDDWLIEKIQLLRKGAVVASGINRLEKILWPDGIFITKHPKRRRAPPVNPSQSSPRDQQSPEMSSPRQSDEQQQLEEEQRAKFVYEIMIDKAPAAIVSLVGRKEYEQCAKDLYFFLQSSVSLKLLAFDLLELLLLSAFPEMDSVFKQLYDEKHKFGEYRAN
ncbi:hypothetical protein NL676_026865 [Syzygium grande]|nr:hypothetical protein NL676_026865 [Syzygium grande]